MTWARPLFRKLKLLNVQQICSFQTGIFMYKHINNTLPHLFDDVFLYNHSIHSHFTRQSHHLHYFPVRINTARFSIMHHGRDIWNNIPDNIKQLDFLLLKSNYKQYLIQV